jgi:hypothetical protein
VSLAAYVVVDETIYLLYCCIPDTSVFQLQSETQECVVRSGVGENVWGGPVPRLDLLDEVSARTSHCSPINRAALHFQSLSRKLFGKQRLCT